MAVVDASGGTGILPNESQTMEFGDYLWTLRRRKWLVVLAVVVVVGSALALSFAQTPVYAARARLIIQPVLSPFDQTPRVIDAAAIETEIQVLQSEPVQAEVRSKLGTAPPVTAVQVGNTSIVQVTAESTKPREAALIADTFAQAYIDVSRQETVDSLLAVSSEIQQRSDALQRDIDALGSKLAGLPACTGVNPPANCNERDSMQRDRDAKIAQQVPFKEKLDQLQVDASLKNGGAKMVSRAAVPTVPIRPRTLHNAALALAFGLVLGVGLAFLMEFLDDSVKTKDDLERAAPSLSVTAIIPAVAGWKAKDEPRVVSLTEPNSSAAEAYRTLRTAVQFMGIDRSLKRIQVTSPSAGEGKTTSLANLAVALARAGQRVVIVCCDLRRPRIHEFFGLSNDIGFTSVLLGEVTLQQAIQKVPGADRLYVLPSGPRPPNPSELLQSRRAEEVFSVLQAQGDYILIDSPPVLPVSDAMILSRYVDGTLLVCSSGNTSRKEVGRAVELMRNVDAPVVGALLNNVTAETSYGYSYRYYRYDYEAYTPTNGNGSSKRRRRRRSKTSK